MQIKNSRAPALLIIILIAYILKVAVTKQKNFNSHIYKQQTNYTMKNVQITLNGESFTLSYEMNEGSIKPTSLTTSEGNERLSDWKDDDMFKSKLQELEHEELKQEEVNQDAAATASGDNEE